MTDAPVSTMDHEDPRERNRRLLRVLLGIMATLIVASFLVGIRW
jgi:hypothetical protein